MKLVRYLESVELLKATKEKQNNGTSIKTYQLVRTYNVMKESIKDTVSATIYGANIIKMWKITTALKDLERMLIPKVDNTEDNISDYFIRLGDNKYKITSVKESGITIERI